MHYCIHPNTLVAGFIYTHECECEIGHDHTCDVVDETLQTSKGQEAV